MVALPPATAASPLKPSPICLLTVPIHWLPALERRGGGWIGFTFVGAIPRTECELEIEKDTLRCESFT